MIFSLVLTFTFFPLFAFGLTPTFIFVFLFLPVFLLFHQFRSGFMPMWNSRVFGLSQHCWKVAFVNGVIFEFELRQWGDRLSLATSYADIDWSSSCWRLRFVFLGFLNQILNVLKFGCEVLLQLPLHLLYLKVCCLLEELGYFRVLEIDWPG